MGVCNSHGSLYQTSRERELLTSQLREHIVRRAINDGNVNMLDQLSKYLSVDLLLNSGETLLNYVIKQGRWQLAELLLQKGATVDLADDTGCKPLQIAVLTENVAMVRLLVEHGADLTQVDITGLNPLQLACNKGNRQITEELLKSGADPNAVTNNKDKKTPLIIAASCGREDCVEALMAGKADPNVKDMWGFTALSKATINQHLACVRTLLGHGADPNLGNRSGATPLQYAALRNHCDILAVLLDKGANVSKFSRDIPPLSAAVLNGCSPCTALLLAAGSDLNVLDKQRKLPLYNAVADPPKVQHLYRDYPLTQTEDRVDCVRLLIDYGADVQAVWRARFWEPRHRAHRQVASYKLMLRATGLRKVNSALTHSLFQKIATLGCTDAIWMFCSAGYSPSDPEVLHVTPWSTDDLCLCCMQTQGQSRAETCHKVAHSDFVNVLQQLRHSPRTLKQLCRNNIRSQLHRNVMYQSSKLPLTDDLKKYVTIDGPNEYMSMGS